MSEIEEVLMQIKESKSSLEMYKKARELAGEINNYFKKNDIWEVTVHPREDREDELHILWLLCKSDMYGIGVGKKCFIMEDYPSVKYKYNKNPINDLVIQNIDNLIMDTEKDINVLENKLKEIQKKEKIECIKDFWFIKNLKWIIPIIIAFFTLLFTFLMYKKM